MFLASLRLDPAIDSQPHRSDQVSWSWVSGKYHNWRIYNIASIHGESHSYHRKYIYLSLIWSHNVTDFGESLCLWSDSANFIRHSQKHFLLFFNYLNMATWSLYLEFLYFSCEFLPPSVIVVAFLGRGPTTQYPWPFPVLFHVILYILWCYGLLPYLHPPEI